MELIIAIALLCQINIGVGTGNKYDHAVETFKRSAGYVNKQQKSCQKELAKCILKKDKSVIEFKTSTMLECIGERY